MCWNRNTNTMLDATKKSANNIYYYYLWVKMCVELFLFSPTTLGGTNGSESSSPSSIGSPTNTTLMVLVYTSRRIFLSLQTEREQIRCWFTIKGRVNIQNKIPSCGSSVCTLTVIHNQVDICLSKSNFWEDLKYFQCPKEAQRLSQHI